MVDVAAVTPLLRTAALTRTFGGLQAVRAVDFAVERGRVHAIIGPNGAGKTTLVGMICGRLTPTSGRVWFKDREITTMPAHRRVHLGIVYTFQVISIYKHLSVFDNVALAAQRRLMGTPGGHVRLDPRRLDDRVAAALRDVGLTVDRAQRAGALPYGHQRLLEVAMALALDPELLALDEPTQGLAPDEIAALSALIRRIAASATILLVEHNIGMVLQLSQRVTVMNGGSIIAEGTPAEIEANPEVQRVYLGR